MTGFFTGSMLVLYPLADALVVPVIGTKRNNGLAEFGAYLVVSIGGLRMVLLLKDVLR